VPGENDASIVQRVEGDFFRCPVGVSSYVSVVDWCRHCPRNHSIVALLYRIPLHCPWLWMTSVVSTDQVTQCRLLSNHRREGQLPVPRNLYFFHYCPKLDVVMVLTHQPPFSVGWRKSYKTSANLKTLWWCWPVSTARQLHLSWISRPNSLRPMRSLSATWAIWFLPRDASRSAMMPQYCSSVCPSVCKV